MKRIIFTLFVVFMSHAITAQTQVFKFEEGRNYCTIEIDTTLAVNMGTFRALGFMDAPYYEMTFKPEFEYTESGEKLLVIIPTWHYHAYLARIYGEVENADLHDPEFRLKFVMDPSGDILTFKTNDSEKRVIYNRSTFSKKKHINFVELPTTMTKTDKVDFEKYPKDLRKNLIKRIDKIKSRLNN